MTKLAADKLFSKTNIKPEDVDVVELHDCFSANELITYEALGLCKPGKAGEFIESGSNTYGGKVVVNPSGGLISKGHPLGATGNLFDQNINIYMFIMHCKYKYIYIYTRRRESGVPVAQYYCILL